MGDASLRNSYSMGRDAASGFMTLAQGSRQAPAWAQWANGRFAYAVPTPDPDSAENTLDRLTAFGLGYSERAIESGLDPQALGAYDFNRDGQTSALEVGLGVACSDLDQDGVVTPWERLRGAPLLAQREENALERYFLKAFEPEDQEYALDRMGQGPFVLESPDVYPRRDDVLE